MSTEFEILQLGNPILRRKASSIDDIDSEEFQQTLKDLMSFVMEKGGMGIAAPQVGISKQFFILSSHPNQRYPYAPDIPPFVVINPKIITRSTEINKDWEGCLSLPGIRGLVPRHQSITVCYQTDDGNQIECEYEGFLARVFQHEYDHLQGKVFLDRIETTLDVMMEKEWQKIINIHSK